MQKGKNPFESPDLKQYFDTLPLIVQESVIQSGVKFESVGDLTKFVNSVYSSGE